MPINGNERSEAEALKGQYNAILQKMQAQGDVLDLLSRIQRITNKPVRLIAYYYFKNEGRTAPNHHRDFKSYDRELLNALNMYSWLEDFAYWKLRLADFRKIRPDFGIKAVMILHPAKTDDQKPSKFELNHNDRKFLKSLGIGADEGQPA